MGEVSPIDYSARVIVELLPEAKKLVRDEDTKLFPALLEVILSLQKRVKGHNFSKEALLSLVKNEYLSGKSVYDLSEMIGNTGYCSFPDEEGSHMYFKSVSQNPPPLRTDYGEEQYTRTIITTPLAAPVVSSFKDEPKTTDKETVVLECPVKQRPQKTDLSNSPTIIALKKKYNELERPDSKYYWQWRVSTEDYEQYLGLLKAVDFSEDTTAKVKLCAKELAFYIAEWYKREYDGGNNSGDCLDSINLDSGISHRIWKGSHPDGVLPYQTEETDRNTWLYSMYVQGGFPIKYAMRAARLSSLFDEMWGEDQAQDIISEEQIDELTRGFDGNQVVKQSLISGSLHNYYRHLLMQGSMPIAESDVDKEPFAEFRKRLQEGKRNYYERFVKPVWNLYLDPYDDIIEGEVQILFGHKGDRFYIPHDCLRYWNIPALDSLYEFEICVRDRVSLAEKHIRFSRTSPGESPFVGWSRDNRIILPVSFERGVSVETILFWEGGSARIGSDFTFGSCCQFYKTARPYEWSSKVDNSAHTAVLFDPTCLDIKSKDKEPPIEDKCFGEGSRIWKWLPLTEEVILVNGSGEERSFAAHNSTLSLTFKQIQYTVKYVNFRDVIHFRTLGDELVQTQVPLMKEMGLTVQFTPYNGTAPVTLRSGQYILEFKNADDNRFRVWTMTDKPGQGLVQIRVTYPGQGVSTTQLVYYLPHERPIRRIVSENKIVFGSSLSDIYAPGDDEPLKMDEEGQPVYFDDVTSGYNPQSDTIPFLIGNPDEDYAVIEVFRSAACKELYLHGQTEPLKRYDQSRSVVEIPIILRDNFEVRSINEKGVTRVKCGEDIYMRFDFDITSFDNNSCNFFDDPANEFRYYVVRRHGVLDGKRGQIQLETGPEQYRFYYWSMKVGEHPVPLDQAFDEETKILTIDTSPLDSNNYGIVFQSLKGVAPRHYFRPIYKGEPPKYTNRKERYLWCFNVASAHCIPFQVFRCLKEVVTPTVLHPVGKLNEFFVEYMKVRNWKPSAQDYKDLHRFAYEFLFDWIMIPRKYWRSRSENSGMLRDGEDRSIGFSNQICREVLTRLFRTSPYNKREEREYLEKILEFYWDLPNDPIEWTFTRSSKPGNILVQHMRGRQGDKEFLDEDYESRLKLLRDLHKCNTLFEDAFRIMIQMQEKIQ